jgi:hypothetical protein
MTTLLLPVLLGSYPNDGTGDDLRTAFQRVNNSFSALSSAIGITGAANVGSGTGIYKDVSGTTLELKSLTSTGNTVTFSSGTNTVNLEAKTTVVNDTNPSLGGNLNLNGYNITGGDSRTTVYGYDQRIGNNLLSILIDNNNLNVDLGSFNNPTGFETNPMVPAGSGHTSGGYSWDFGSNFTTTSDHINFGYITTTQLIQDGKNHQVILGGNLVTTGGGNLTLNVASNSVLTLPSSGTLITNTSPSISNPVLTGTTTVTNINVSGTLKVNGLNLKSLAIAMSAALG